MQSIKRLVSGNKARFKDPELKLELDLVYLTDEPNIILMGYPASGVAALYRNNRDEVLTFLQSRHGDKYRIYNFVPLYENGYDADFFHGRVSRYPFPDHHAPPLSLISLFVTDIAHWLEQDPERAAAIHCKAGKGRTGTLAISYLLSLPYLPQGPAPINNLIRKSKQKGSNAGTTLGSSSSAATSTRDVSTSTLTRPSPPALHIETNATSASTSHRNGGAIPESPQTPASTQGAASPYPEYLFALHTQQRMKPKFSKSQWVARALNQDNTSSVGTPISSGASSPTSNAPTSLSRRPSKSPLSQQIGTDENGAGHTSAANGSRDATQNKAADGPGLTADGFDAVIQATADAAGPSKGPLNRLAQRNDGNGEPGGSAEPGQVQSQDGESSQNGDDDGKPRKYGVSIASQRRFVGYWHRILHGQDARAPLEQVDADRWTGSPSWGRGLRGRRRAQISEIIVLREPGASQSTSSRWVEDHIRVHVSRYNDDLVHRLEAEEWRVRTGPNAILTPPSSSGSAAAADADEKNGDRQSAREDAVERARTWDWGRNDEAARYATFATFKHSTLLSSPRVSGSGSDREGDSIRLTPHKVYDPPPKGGVPSTSTSTRGTRATGSLAVDPDRELLLTMYVSKTHARMLPHVACLASAWIVPCFEEGVEEESVLGKEGVQGEGEGEGKKEDEREEPSRRRTTTRRFRTRVGREGLDWCKGIAGIAGLEIVWQIDTQAD